MENTNLENRNLRRTKDVHSDANLSALADSLQFLSLGVPGISRSKNFNVNAWSTPLKSIENLQRRVVRDENYEMETTTNDVNVNVNLDDDSLSNVSDLFRGQNVFEKTSDFIEFYCLASPEESRRRTSVGDRTGFSTLVHRTLSLREPVLTDSYSPASATASPPPSSAPTAACDLPGGGGGDGDGGEPEQHLDVPFSRSGDSYACEGVDQWDVFAGGDPSSPPPSAVSNRSRSKDWATLSGHENDGVEQSAYSCSDCDRSFVVDCEDDRDSTRVICSEETVDISSIEKSWSESDNHAPKSSPISLSNIRDNSRVRVTNEPVEFCLVDAVPSDEPVSLEQLETCDSSSSKTPTTTVDRGQDLLTDKLARVCDSVNKFMSLCTPLKDARTQSRTSINPFRCATVGNEGHKIVFDFPTNLLDVSIGMLENMTTLMAPVESASSVTRPYDENIASDLINIVQTPKVFHAQSNRSHSSSRPNVSNINTRLLEENENLKTELEEYKNKYDVLRVEYESVLKVAHALRTNESRLKKALQEYEDETRKACNNYLILKDYATNLIMSSNRYLDQCEEELKMKNDELQKLKHSLR